MTEGDATGLPYPDGRFSAVLCFTMLHHIPTVEQQDQAFAEIARVLRPGGTFAGTDSIGTGWLFKAIHIGDTLNLIDPDGLPARLEGAGVDGPRGEARRVARSGGAPVRPRWSGRPPRWSARRPRWSGRRGGRSTQLASGR